MTPSERRKLIRSLPEKTAVELRRIAREHELPITYLEQRRRVDLLELIESHLRARA